MVHQYDLNTLWSNVSESGDSIEVRRIHYEGSPVTNILILTLEEIDGSYNMLDGFGWGNYSTVSFMMMPMYADLLKVHN